jgi:flavin reductase (DIM6/NTAB) family NADH-FMN oxidoreductase RutF
MQPKRYFVAVYKNTKTLELVQKENNFVLQSLHTTQFNLVKLLGKQTGFKIDKIASLTKKNFIADWQNFKILKDSLSVVHLKIIQTIDCGDHVGFLCDVVKHQNLQIGEELTTTILKDKKIIRA